MSLKKRGAPVTMVVINLSEMDISFSTDNFSLHGFIGEVTLRLKVILMVIY